MAVLFAEHWFWCRFMPALPVVNGEAVPNGAAGPAKSNPSPSTDARQNTATVNPEAHGSPGVQGGAQAKVRAQYSAY